MVTQSKADTFSPLNSYLDYRLPVDIRQVNTLPDIDVSQALASRLVELGTEGQIVSGLAARWKVDPDRRAITFFLRPDSKWSDGSPLLAGEVVQSFEQTKLHYGKAIPSLFESYSRLSRIDDHSVEFILTSGVRTEKFLEKLTEVMHGIVKPSATEMNRISCGPYYLIAADAHEMVMRANPNWFGDRQNMFEEVRLRPSPTDLGVGTFLKDPWPTVIAIPNLTLKGQLARLPSNYSIWRRNLDRLYSLRAAGRSSLPEIKALFGILQRQPGLRNIHDLLDGAVVADQIYPKGLILHSDEKMNPASNSLAEFKHLWRYPTLKILYPEHRVPNEVIERLDKEICTALGLPCEFEAAPLGETPRLRRENKFDLFFSGVGVDVVNLDGALSYYVETNPASIPSDTSAAGNFVARLKTLRTSSTDEVADCRKILADAVNLNHILPLFHTSTLMIGRENVDFSRIPVVFESAPFHFIRRKP